MPNLGRVAFYRSLRSTLHYWDHFSVCLSVRRSSICNARELWVKRRLFAQLIYVTC